jgi:cytochrome c-type biogenesis protein CcmH
MRGLVVLLLAFLSVPVSAQDNMPPAPYAYRQLENPAQEAEAKALMEELRCLKCQSQSIADSDAPMAGDMRSQVRERIAAGQKPEEIRGWLIERYGDWVSYNPPMSGQTLVLWLLPLLLLGAGLWLARGLFRRRGKDS